jgi:hypothetical protein
MRPAGDERTWLLGPLESQTTQFVVEIGHGVWSERRQKAESCQLSVFSFQFSERVLAPPFLGGRAGGRTSYPLRPHPNPLPEGEGTPRCARCSSFILHPSSFILHPSSFILHPSSFILHPAPCSLLPAPRATSKSCNVAQLAVRKWPGGIPKRLRNKHAGSFDSHCALRSAAFFAVCGC